MSEVFIELSNEINIQHLIMDLWLMTYLEQDLNGYVLIDIIQDEVVWRKRK